MDVRAVARRVSSLSLSASSDASRLPPFSLGEFSELVTSALSSSSHGANPNQSALSLQLSLRFPGSPPPLPAPPPTQVTTTTTTTTTTTRKGVVQRWIGRLKTLVASSAKRARRKSKPASTQPSRLRRPTRVSVASSSFFSREDHHEGGPVEVQSAPPCGSGSGLPFGYAVEPFVPLVVQYERAAAASDPAIRRRSETNPGPRDVSTPFPPSPTASLFSRSSNWHASSECSAGATSSSCDTSVLATPASAAAFSPYRDPVTYSPIVTRPWSALTVRAPDADPFAKSAMRVVHRSCEALPHPRTPPRVHAPAVLGKRLPPAPVPVLRRRPARVPRLRVASTIAEAPPPTPPKDDWTLALGLGMELELDVPRDVGVETTSAEDDIGSDADAEDLRAEPDPTLALDADEPDSGGSRTPTPTTALYRHHRPGHIGARALPPRPANPVSSSLALAPLPIHAQLTPPRRRFPFQTRSAPASPSGSVGRAASRIPVPVRVMVQGGSLPRARASSPFPMTVLLPPAFP